MKFKIWAINLTIRVILRVQVRSKTSFSGTENAGETAGKNSTMQMIHAARENPAATIFRGNCLSAALCSDALFMIFLIG